MQTFAKASARGLVAACLFCLGSAGVIAGQPAGQPLDAVTFAAEPDRVYVVLREALQELGWRSQRDNEGLCTHVEACALSSVDLRQLVDGTELIRLDALQRAGVQAIPDAAKTTIAVNAGRRGFLLVTGAKRVVINLAEQRLRAWQGRRLVLQTHVSTGRGGSTPMGSFTAGPFRARMHYSSRYHYAPMPWSVQIHGHVFIHGFASVPDYPASHGCIRMPLTDGNPARFFFEWVDDGTPVQVIAGTPESVNDSAPSQESAGR